jgi:hypothetical protein
VQVKAGKTTSGGQAARLSAWTNHSDRDDTVGQGRQVCAMRVGFLSSFFAGGRKKLNKFGSAELHFVPVPSNLHCPFKKLNPSLF